MIRAGYVKVHLLYPLTAELPEGFSATVCVCSKSLQSLTNITQGRSTKIKTGQAIDDVTQTRGLGACPPRKIFEI